MKWAKISTIKLEDLRLEIALKNLAIVMSRPRIEVTAMIPMSKNEICWDQNLKIKLELPYTLVPLPDVHFVTQMMYNDLNAFCHRIDLTNSIKNNVHGWNEDLPNAIGGKEVTDNVEVFALPCVSVFISSLKFIGIFTKLTKYLPACCSTQPFPKTGVDWTPLATRSHFSKSYK
jgi:hypothetical protein